jgi:hypothetical protein
MNIKTYFFAFLALMMLCGCHVRHDHGQQMPGSRMGIDSVPNNTIGTMSDEEIEALEKEKQEEEEDWMKEDGVYIPDIPKDAKGEAHPEAVDAIERMLQGKE